MRTIGRLLGTSCARAILALLLLSGFVTSVVAQPVGISAPAYGASNFQPINDQRGNVWIVQQSGTVDTGNRSFQGGGMLTLSGTNFIPKRNEMSKDGSEYIFTGDIGRIHVVRRIKIDVATSSARFVDSFTNTGDALDTRDVLLSTSLRTTGACYTETGVSNPRTLDPKSSGVVLISQFNQYPAIGVWLASPKSKERPATINMTGRQLQTTYKLRLAKGATVAIVHGLAIGGAQGGVALNPYGPPTGAPLPAPPNPSDPKTLAAVLAPFDPKTWVRDLPADVRRSLVNFVGRGSVEATPGGAPLKAMLELVEQAGVDRSEGDTLVVEDDQTLKGTVASGSFAVTTVFGKAELPIEQVALMIGGAGKGQIPRVYLRNGEVLVGDIAATDFALTTETGLKVDLVPELLEMLVFKASASDNQPPEGAAALLTTAGGDRLAVKIEPDEKLQLLTAWGPFATNLTQIEALAYEQSPQPGYRLWLENHSQLNVLLASAPLELQTTRWGKTRLAASALRRWERLNSARPEGAASDDINVPHAKLAGENILVGELAERELHLSTAGGVRTIEPKQIARLERDDDGAFHCELADGVKLEGGLQEAVLTLQSGERTWRVPARQLVSLRGAK
jgi:hypothetical protein